MIEQQRLSAAHPVLTCAEAQAWEKRLLGDDESLAWSAMFRAGNGVGRAILEDSKECGGIPQAGRLLALCGKGHNGGDALLALHTVLDARPKATAAVVIVPDFARLRPLVRRAFERLVAAHRDRIAFSCVSGTSSGSDARRLRAWLDSSAFDLCLDGLLGMQFRPPMRDPAGWLIECVNAHPGIRFRAAIDVPTGIGDASDPCRFRADFSYATGMVKQPLLDPPNRGSVGRIRYVDIGFFRNENPGTCASAVLTSAVLRPLADLRAAHTDKRTHGHLFVVSGSRTMPGAVLMAVESAIQSGVGLVTAFVPESVAPGFAARVPEAMWVPMPETPAGGLALEGRNSVIARATRCTALLAGPGLGRERESLALVMELLNAIDVPAVLDGDALQPDVVEVRAGSDTPSVVLTPHAGEFARISGTRDDGDHALRDASRRLNAAIALKGAPTRVCGGDTVYVAPFGGPVLSRGGSGDVLAGLIAGRLAAGCDPLVAAAQGVAWHGIAADLLARAGGQTAQRVTKLTDHLGAALREVGCG